MTIVSPIVAKENVRKTFRVLRLIHTFKQRLVSDSEDLDQTVETMTVDRA